MIALGALFAALAAWSIGETVAGRPVRLRVRARRSRPGRVSCQVWLSQAGAAVTPGQFWAVSAAVGVVSFLVLFALSRTVVVAAIPAVALAASPYGYWATARRRRAAARLAAWPDGLRYVIGALEASISTLHDAVAELSRSGPEPLRPPIGRSCVW